MDIQIFAVCEQQVEFVALRHIADYFIKESKSFLKMQPCTVFSRRIVQPVEQIEENALAVGIAVLRFEVGVKRGIIENRAVVNERPAPSRDVLSRKGMTVFVFYVTDGCIAECERAGAFFGDPG